MYNKLKDLPISVEIYAPYGTKPEQLTFEFLENHLIRSHKEVIGSKSVPFNKKWLLILDAMQKINNDDYVLPVGRRIFQKLCYIITLSGVETGLEFKRSSYGPYSKEVNDIITVFSNANLIKESISGPMIRMETTENFKMDPNEFSKI